MGLLGRLRNLSAVWTSSGDATEDVSQPHLDSKVHRESPYYLLALIPLPSTKSPQAHLT